jgi:L-methionine (R)-S-oxide reductase
MVESDLMEKVENPLVKLQDLSQFLSSSNLSDNLAQLAATTARIVNAQNCSIMLLNAGEGEEMRMSICANHGSLPNAALKETIGKGDGIAGHVLTSGRSLLIENIQKSEFSELARRIDDPNKSMMSAPVRIEGKIAGVVNVSGLTRKGTFNITDLHLLEVIALFVGKSVQVVQLQNILNSRFAQMALMQEMQGKLSTAPTTVYQNPDQVVKILAKSFFKEMTKAGFTSDQIVRAASEIIDHLCVNIQRHSKRVAREGAAPEADEQ